MLLGIITNETNNEHYFLHLDNNDLSIIHTNSTNTEYLSKEKAKDLFRTLLSSKLSFLEKENDYDVYLDEANNRRYFKNGKENYIMLFENNGVDAIYYIDKINKNNTNIPKRYKFIVNSVVFSMILTSVLSIPLTGDIRYLDIGKRVISNAVTLTSDEMINLMKNSPYLNEEDTNILCNEDYLKFVLKYSDTNDRNFYLREKLHNINVKYYNKNYIDVIGYYQSLDINTIHIVEDLNVEKAKPLRNNVMTHEFIHLTQCDCKYTYIIEASAELIKSEFYDIPIVSYEELITRLKVLMEIIGTEPVLECIYKNDNTKLESEINNNLSIEEAKALKSLLTTGKVYKNIETTGNINYQIDMLLSKMYKNKTGNDIKDDAMICAIYSNQDNGRIYFNYNLENYYKDFRLPDESELVGEIDINDIFDSDKVESYQYPHSITETVNGKKENIHSTIETTDYKSIPLDEITFINVIFKDGTIGFATHDIHDNKWSKVTCYKTVEKYEPSIFKKFPVNKEEVFDMINDKTIQETTKKVL